MSNPLAVFTLGSNDLKDCYSISGPDNISLPAVHQDHAAWVCDCMNLAYGAGWIAGTKLELAHREAAERQRDDKAEEIRCLREGREKLIERALTLEAILEGEKGC